MVKQDMFHTGKWRLSFLIDKLSFSIIITSTVQPWRYADEQEEYNLAGRFLAFVFFAFMICVQPLIIPIGLNGAFPSDA
jgi:hypothetical protein